MSLLISGDLRLAKDSVAATDTNIREVSLLLHGDGANGSTTITDSSLTPKTVTAAGNAQISTAIADPFGSSTGVIAFDGTGDYLECANNDFIFGSNDFTVEFWVYFPSGFVFTLGMSPVAITTLTGEPEIFAPFSIRSSAGNVKSYIWGDSVWSIALGVEFTTITRDTWQHWAITRSGSSWKLFSNGIALSSFTSSQAINNPNNTAKLLVARGFTDGVKDVQCYIDDLRITKGVARYTSNFTPPTAPFPDF